MRDELDQLGNDENPDRGWELQNAEAKNAEAPRSFFIPPREVRERLSPGDGVKLLFDFSASNPPDQVPAVERMWVKVEDVRRDGTYRGVLENKPMHPRPIRLGDRLEFRPEHVAAIFDENPDVDPRTAAMVFRRLLQDDSITRPGYVYRDAPPDRQSGGEPRDDGRIDSGWQFFVGDETDEDMTVENAAISELSWLLERYPDLLPLIKSDPPAGAWEWSDETKSYEPEVQ